MAFHSMGLTDYNKLQVPLSFTVQLGLFVLCRFVDVKVKNEAWRLFLQPAQRGPALPSASRKSANESKT